MEITFFEKINNLFNELNVVSKKQDDINRQILLLKKNVSEKIKELEFNYSYIEIFEVSTKNHEIIIYVLDYENIGYNMGYIEQHKFSIVKDYLSCKIDNEYTKDIKNIEIVISKKYNINLYFFFKDNLNFEKLENFLNDLRQKIQQL